MWDKPPQDLSLTHNDVHIWMLDIESYGENVNKFREILSREEQEKAKRFYSSFLQESFIISRGCLRIILSRYLGIKPQKISFIYNQKGKPLLDREIFPKIEFNLSHKNNYAVYGISKEKIGIDLEKIDDKVQVENIAKRFFCEEESHYIINLSSEKKVEYFFKLWTIKEAYLKAIGEGLSAGLDSICLTLDENNQKIKFLKKKKDQEEDNNWQLKTRNLSDNYIMSIAINSRIQPNFYYYIYL